ncbi:clustered mitochondria protein homolog [Striga asiatica]|uniref:Clustered mitochondria protein homolog n=1 Tax=Striga asiatica TaxID=4170 RepID=A0A5A7R3J0_STRAF|nr:clustered mitochondria protein homolog [Striga asiatica]
MLLPKKFRYELNQFSNDGERASSLLDIDEGGGDEAAGRKKPRLSKEQAATLKDTLKEQKTLNPWQFMPQYITWYCLQAFTHRKQCKSQCLKCPMKGKKYNASCAKGVIESLGLDLRKIEGLMDNTNADVDNPVLKDVQEAQIIRDRAVYKITSDFIEVATSGSIEVIRRCILPINPTDPECFHMYFGFLVQIIGRYTRTALGA